MSPASQIRGGGGMLADMEEHAMPGAESPVTSPGSAFSDVPTYARSEGANLDALKPSPAPFTSPGACEADLCAIRSEGSEPVLPEAQRRWAARPLAERLQPIRKARHWIAAHPEAFARAISSDLARAEADTLVTELLPLLEAMRFLERKAYRILAPRKLGVGGRPLWLTGVQAEIHRDPLGHILVIGPANFPLFLPGVQVLQALVAGNSVTWKPGAGGEQVALLFAHALRDAGLPRGILHVTDDSVQAGQSALAHHADKVVFTGSFETGSRILRTLADTATPATMELSGADAVVVLPSADLKLVAQAVAFGLRLNGGEVCMSPRRLIATRETLATLRPLLQSEVAKVPAVPLKPQTATKLADLLKQSRGATSSQLEDPSLTTEQEPSAAVASGKPLLLDHVTPDMPIARTDIFAPVLSLIEAPSVLHLADIVNNNPYALTAAIFGAPREAQTLAAELRVGTVLINDLIAPTADPRVPFGGRGKSGFGLTRGAEGLLEMTAGKTVLLRRKGITQHYAPLGKADLPLFTGLIGALHGGTLAGRWGALRRVISAARARSR